MTDIAPKTIKTSAPKERFTRKRLRASRAFERTYHQPEYAEQDGHLVRMPMAWVQLFGALRQLGAHCAQRSATLKDPKAPRFKIMIQMDTAGQLDLLLLCHSHKADPSVMTSVSEHLLFVFEFRLTPGVLEQLGFSFEELTQLDEHELLETLFEHTLIASEHKLSLRQLQELLNQLPLYMTGMWSLMQNDHKKLSVPEGIFVDQEDWRRVSRMSGKSHIYSPEKHNARQIKLLLDSLYICERDQDGNLKAFPALVHLTPEERKAIQDRADRFELRAGEDRSSLERDEITLKGLSQLERAKERGQQQAPLHAYKLHAHFVEQTSLTKRTNEKLRYLTLHPSAVELKISAFMLVAVLQLRTNSLSFKTTHNGQRLDEHLSFGVTVPTLLRLSGFNRHEQPWRCYEELRVAIYEASAAGFLSEVSLPLDALNLEHHSLERLGPISRKTLLDESLKISFTFAEQMLAMVPKACLQEHLRASQEHFALDSLLTLLSEPERTKKTRWSALSPPPKLREVHWHRPSSWELKPKRLTHRYEAAS